jgi:transcriptional regulator with XRE-family HTH domain
MDPDATKIEDRIRQIMESQNMSQQDFARLLQISPASLSSIFNGRTRPTNNHTMAIHKAFPKLNINWLLFGEGSMYSEAPAEHREPASYAASSQDVLSPTLPFETPGEPSEPLPYNVPPATKKDVNLPRYAMVKNIDVKQRKIKEIRVFYDDGTYEAFVPQK